VTGDVVDPELKVSSLENHTTVLYLTIIVIYDLQQNPTDVDFVRTASTV